MLVFRFGDGSVAAFFEDAEMIARELDLPLMPKPLAEGVPTVTFPATDLDEHARCFAALSGCTMVVCTPEAKGEARGAAEAQRLPAKVINILCGRMPVARI